MKTASRILLLAVLFVFTTAVVSAQKKQVPNNKKERVKTATKKGNAFTDTNKNGVCDNYESRLAGGKGKYFADKNSDGVCDNCGNQGQCKGQGCGKGQGCSKGQGKGNCTGVGGGQHRHGQHCGQGQSQNPSGK